MKRWKRFIVIVLSLLFFLMLITIIPMLIRPYRRPRGMIKNHILRITPLGTSIEDVIKIIENRNDFGDMHVNLERGFTPSTPASGWYAVTGQRGVIPVIGEMSIRVHLGTYRAWHKWFPLMEWEVIAFWGFDGDGNLIDVHIQETGMS